MKILLVNFSPKKKGACGTALEYAAQIIGKTSNEAVCFHAAGAAEACCDCRVCLAGRGCVSGAVNLLAEALREADGAVLATPTHYGLPISTALSLMSRVIRACPDAVRAKPMLALATARRAGAVNACRTLNTMLSFADCPTVCATYPCVLYGSRAEDIMRDAEGLQNIREGIERLIWLSECIKSGKEAGIKPPLPEIKIKTDISML